MAKLLVNAVNRLLTIDVEQVVDVILHSLFGSHKFGQVGAEAGHSDLVAEVVLNGVRQHKVTIGQTLHKGRSTQAVGTVVREVTLTNGEQTRNVGREFVVNPKTTHCVVNGGVNHHRVGIFDAVVALAHYLAGLNVGDFFVHVEEVAITLEHHVDAQTADSLSKVEVYGKASVVHTKAGVATLLGSTRSYVAGNEVTESGVTAFKIVVAVGLVDVGRLDFALLQLDGVFLLLGHPDTAIVTQ